MASRTLSVVIAGDPSGTKRALGDVETATTSMSDKLKTAGASLTRNLSLPLAAGFAFAAKQAIDEEAAVGRLDQALSKNLDMTKAQRAGVEEQITAWQNSTGIMDDKLRPALARLVQSGRSWEQAQGDMSIAMDISRAKGLDLETVTNAMAKASLGNVGALGRLGIATKDAAGETLSFDDILKNASDTMGRAAAAHAETSAGKMEILRAKFADLVETIGARLIPIFEDLVGAFAGVADTFASLPEGAQTAIVVVGLMAVALGPLLTVLGNVTTAIGFMSTALTFLATNPAVAWIAVAALAVGAVVGLTKAFSDNAAQVDIDLAKLSKMNEQTLVANINRLQEVERMTGEVNLTNRVFADVLDKDVVQAQRFIDAAGEAGVNTEGWDRKLRNKIQTDAEHAFVLQLAKDKTDALAASIFAVPEGHNTDFTANTSAIDAAIERTRFNIATLDPSAMFGFDFNRFSEGGWVGGPSGAGDVVPAMLSPGEFVLSKDMLAGRAAMPSSVGGGGNTYSITVNVAPGGSPADTGRAVVETIKEYERRAGSSWRN